MTKNNRKKNRKNRKRHMTSLRKRNQLEKREFNKELENALSYNPLDNPFNQADFDEYDWPEDYDDYEDDYDDYYEDEYHNEDYYAEQMYDKYYRDINCDDLYDYLDDYYDDFYDDAMFPKIGDYVVCKKTGEKFIYTEDNRYVNILTGRYANFAYHEVSIIK